MEKFIFWLLLPVLFAAVIIGANIQEKKRQSSDEFLKDIESVTEKAKAKKKIAADSHDIEGLKKQETSVDYASLMEKGIFLKPFSEVKDEEKTGVVIPLKEEEPEKPVFVYKGRMTLGGNIIVIIEDENTGKSFSVKEGDATDSFTVLGIGEKEIRLKKKDGEEIAISMIKEQKKEKVGEGLKPSPTKAMNKRIKILKEALDNKNYPALAKNSGVKVIHISERDTQITDKPKEVDEFVNTWSIEGFFEEGIAPAEMGWGTHEKNPSKFSP